MARELPAPGLSHTIIAMPLGPGDRLAHYEIVEAIGKGGMGEVFRARDSKLDRDVAIKVLPEELATDEERIARFEREAKLLASLNHTNIASIHGFEDARGVKALVLELVEGPTIAERIAGGPVPVEEAIAIARQIADALESGHEAGIIHRDLKPANIKLKNDGTVKVLDYGLAKAIEGESASDTDSELSQSPTLTRQGTQVGVILGTAAYMSPEQAKGKPVDRRTDIWAFGAVLYEMLTGRRAFAGEDVSDTLAAVLRSDIEWSRLPRETPASVARLLRRCLTRDPKERLQHIGDARLELSDASTDSTAGEPTTARPVRWLALSTVATLALAMGAASTWFATRTPADDRVHRFVVPLDTMVRMGGFNPIVSITPDGRSLIYGDRGLIQRPLAELESEPVLGAERARQPFFSPDGEWMAFFEGSVLKKMRLGNDLPITVTEHVAGGVTAGGSWSDDGTIVFAGVRQSLRRVSADGGDSETAHPDDDGSFMWPDILPGGAAMIASRSEVGPTDPSGIWIIPLTEGPPVKLIHGGFAARWVPTGHIVFQRDETLYAQRFDPERLELKGDVHRLLDGMYSGYMGRAPQWTFSENGTLAYMRSDEVGTRTLVWVDRSGNEKALPVDEQQFLSPSLSPDGRRIAVTITSSRGFRELWTLSVDGGSFARLTIGNAQSSDPVWSPDGETIAFAHAPRGNFNIMTQPSSGIAEPTQRTNSRGNLMPRAWTPDGRTLLLEQLAPRSIGLLNVETDELQVLERNYEESQPAISPDGRFLAYSSNETGQWEVFLRAFADEQRKWQVSASGGREPVFSRDGREIFYRDGDKMMAAALATEPDVLLGTPSVLFEAPYAVDPFGRDSRNYDIAPDGKRFLMIKETVTNAEVVVVLNWFRELEALSPP